MRNLAVFSIVLLCLAFVGCGALSKDAEVNAFVTDVDRVTKEIARKIEADPTAKGVEDAQRILDDKKADLKTRFDALEKVRGFQISEETGKKLVENLANNMMAINELKVNYLEKAGEDAAFARKLDKLVADFNAMFGV